MDRLVKNLLDLSALELKDRFETSSLDISRLAASVLQDFQKNIEISEIKLTADIQNGVQLQGDKEKIRRILINVLDNAIKYNSRDNKEIHFHLATGKDLIHIEIYNTGPGIPAEDFQHVFKQFYRIEKSRATALGGSGLGLTIVKRIVELHHGTIEIASSHGHWTQVQIRLPVHPPAT
jgi:signal transduction histidine kinase